MRRARRELLRVLDDIAGEAADRSLARCPYRAADDVCTFHAGCRNQRRRAPGVVLCSGAALNPEPAS